MSPPPDPLDPLLDRWGRPPPAAPLATDVRRRLSRREARPPAAPASWWLEPVFNRPAFAALFLAACVLLGLFLAELRVSRLHRERDAQLLRSYRQLIDPLLDAAPVIARHDGGRP